MATNICIKRLSAEIRTIRKEPIEGIKFAPCMDNLLLWYFMFDGSPGSALEGGKYIGIIVFPPDYPNNAPTVALITPNGVFETNTPICLSVTSFHPESWNPSWKSFNLVTALQSLMYDGSKRTFLTAGSTRVHSQKEMAELAASSHEFNKKWMKANPNFEFF